MSDDNPFAPPGGPQRPTNAGRANAAQPGPGQPGPGEPNEPGPGHPNDGPQNSGQSNTAQSGPAHTGAQPGPPSASHPGPSSYPGGFPHGAPSGRPPLPPYAGPASGPAPSPYGGPVPSSSPGQGRKGLGGGALVLVVVIALVAGLIGGFGGAALLSGGGGSHPSDADLPATNGQAIQRPEGSVAAIAAEVLPSVVSIEVRAPDGAATGSGMVLKDNGFILTNNHVIALAEEKGAPIFVTFSDGHEKKAEIVGATPDYDLAVIKVDEEGLTPLVLGDSGDVVVGDPVLAAGAPLGLESTVTTGIVSALHRPVQAGDQSSSAFIDAIQTDAAINPGNSGGPLLNTAGEVIGINSAIAQAPGSAAATGSIGLGFAIPSNQARRTAEQLIETGEATFPVIGVLLDAAYQGEGVKVIAEGQQGMPPVTPGGPADDAGIVAGDVILSINERPVSRSDELVVAIRALAPGDAVTLRVRSAGQKEGRDVRVVLDEKTSG